MRDLLSFILLALVSGHSNASGVTMQQPLTEETPKLSIGLQWQVLGPFQIGTREAAWGADSLELYGGFHNLEYDKSIKYPSSLGLNGSATWSTAQAEAIHPSTRSSSVALDIKYDEIDWKALHAVYGFAAAQYYVWARGSFEIRSDSVQTVLCRTPGILEFSVDGKKHFGGDFFSYEGTPLVLHLNPGVHRFDARIIREARLHGGVGPMNVKVQIDLEIPQSLLAIDESHLVVSDIVEGQMAASFASVPLTNAFQSPVTIVGVDSENSDFTFSLLNARLCEIHPGQTRPLGFKIQIKPGSRNMSLIINYRVHGVERPQSVSLYKSLKERSISDLHKVTHLHPSGIVSYSALRPPPSESVSSEASLPVMLMLHGAGVEVDSQMMLSSLDKLSDLPVWTLLPTGANSWSSDDWHRWGWADVEAAIASIPSWIERFAWNNSKADISKWLVLGHSNGGQGAYYALTHRMESVIAAAPVAGYTSIQNYVPYTFWAVSEPIKAAVVQAALNSYRHELLVGNFQHVPVILQHGTADFNVPSYHSRFMFQRISQLLSEVEFYELEGKDHWFDGIMETEQLRMFYKKQLAVRYRQENKASTLGLATSASAMKEPVPWYLTNFTITVANPGDTGPKNGFHVKELVDPARLGLFEYTYHDHKALMKLSNIRYFTMAGKTLQSLASSKIDQTPVPEALASAEHTIHAHLDSNQQWLFSDSNMHEKPDRRTGDQLGNLDAILASKSAFSILNRMPSSHVALQISRTLHTYYAADSEIVSNEEDCEELGNRITIALAENSATDLLSDSSDHPIQVSPTHVTIRDKFGSLRSYWPGERSLGGIYLRPIPGTRRLDLVIWGTDEESVETAARLIPMLPGTGQPDFVIFNRDIRWKGASGALALGFLDSDWNISRSSF